MPLISIIVPVYKAEKYLNRCVDSILNQTLKDFELILIDDGSPDQSGNLCDNWAQKDNRVRVIHQDNKGAGAARNAGLNLAHGDYIGFVDSDDWIEPQMYEILYKAILAYDSDISECSLISRKQWSKRDNYDVDRFPFVVKNREEMLSMFFRVHGEKRIFSVCSKLIKKSLLNNFKFKEGTISEDISASYYFIMKTNRVAVTDFSFYNYFVNQQGVTKSPVTMKDMEYIQAFLRIYHDIKKSYPKFEGYAYMNYIRSNYTILCKMDLFGYDKSNHDLVKKHQQLKSTVRRNFKRLLCWPMPVSRKILLFYVVL